MAPLDATAHAAPPEDLDATARRTAFLETGRSLLLEAGAGSGKTSVLAGRVVRLMAEGRAPSTIAAISFTELSASELRERIVRFLDTLLAGEVPDDLRLAFPEPPGGAELENLRTACADLDELTCTTIHGFCRILLTPYPVEACLDPGASMLDEVSAELLLDETRDRWLRERLGGPADDADPFTAMYTAAPAEMGELLERLVENLLRRRGAEVAGSRDPWLGDEVETLREAIRALTAFTGTAPGWAPDEFSSAASALAGIAEGLPPGGASEAALLSFVLTCRVPAACAVASGGFGKDKVVGTTKAAWERGAAGIETKATAHRLAAGAKAAMDPCRDAWEALLPAAAGRVLYVVAEEARAVLRRYDEAKRASALLDFGDLLEKARLLLAGHDGVRHALAGRFQAVLVDEFQDTDLEQTEVFWRLCGAPPEAEPDAGWRGWTLRPGALFLVGDPQQSIYRFRSADLGVFHWVRDAIAARDPGAVIRISRNFRSRPGILEWVNGRFAGCLGGGGGSGYAPLEAAVDEVLTGPAVAALDVACEGSTSNDLRDAEAEAVARTCRALVNQLDVRDRDGTLRKCRAGDIALLVPTGTELWRYERALEDAGLSVAAQAGKGFFRRQEVQDLIALTRTIADERDRLALGALLRGPLVGLSDEALLDAVESLPPDPDGRPPMLTLRMALPDDGDPILRSRLEVLRSIADRRHATTPHLLLCTAVEEMGVRATLRARGDRVAERALANVDVFLELSRAYAVRGLRAFSDAMRTQWEEARRAQDGRPDADLQSVSLITMHSAKGLEWHVVIPVNTSSTPDDRLEVAYDGARNRLHLSVMGHRSADCDAVFGSERAEMSGERQRLWYVAATRARDMLLMPRMPGGPRRGAWSGLVEFGVEELPAFGADLVPLGMDLEVEPPNAQDEATFRQEAEIIVSATPTIQRRTPHLAEGDEDAVDVPSADVVVEPDEGLPRGGFRRGLVLHKLLEEVLTGEVPDDAGSLAARAAELIAQVVAPGPAPDPGEVARIVVRALALESIAAIRARLVPECPVAASIAGAEIEEVVLGVADAVVAEGDGRITTVVDWKSDVVPKASDVARYRGQLGEYLRATGADLGMLVFLSTGEVVRVSGPRREATA